MTPRLATLVNTLPGALLIAVACGCAQVKSVFSSLEQTTVAAADTIATIRAVDQPRWFAVPGPVGIDVESFGGNVVVTVDPELTHAAVTFTRRALHGPGRKTEAELSLAEIACDVSIVPGDLGPVLQVRTSTTHAEPWFQRADVRIELPDVDGFRVRTKRGRVVAKGIAGTVDVVASGGNVRVMTPKPMIGTVRILNSEGDIDYRIRGESRGAIDCEAVRGKVFHHVEYGRLIVHTGTRHDTLRATFNEGENPVVLRTIDGDIRVAVVEAPTHVGQFIGF